MSTDLRATLRILNDQVVPSRFDPCPSTTLFLMKYASLDLAEKELIGQALNDLLMNEVRLRQDEAKAILCKIARDFASSLQKIGEEKAVQVQRSAAQTCSKLMLDQSTFQRFLDILFETRVVSKNHSTAENYCVLALEDHS